LGSSWVGLPHHPTWGCVSLEKTTCLLLNKYTDSTTLKSLALIYFSMRNYSKHEESAFSLLTRG
jgi:hypothetical protein